VPLYELSVTTSAQSSEAQAATSTVDVEQQVITEGFIFIDPGANGEVQAQLRFGDRTLLPARNSGTVRVPAVRQPSPINVQLPGTPNPVQLRAFAPDADFEHEVIAQFEAVPPENTTQEVRLVGTGDGDSGPSLTEAREALSQMMR